ncbi:hypothetical protein E3E26_08985 [Thermococcus sp. LS1]|uniref:hypothetical protein n=1 Tax=Thermococcus sp. LS1 TaxID=1638259 RepID=UPI00143C89CD|nr:hypothetical protein [Thermococcus sp. LS1]NJD99909.1 hypothetical protein [Thermococcus sp. LS1]
MSSSRKMMIFFTILLIVGSVIPLDFVAAIYGSVVARDATDEAIAILNSEFHGSFVSAQFTGVEEQILLAKKPILGFPIEGDSYVILSSGDARYVVTGNGTYDVGSVGGVSIAGGHPATGQDIYDVAKLAITLKVPYGAKVLSFKWRMVTDDYPDYNDFFYAYVVFPDGTKKIVATLPNGTIPYITAINPYLTPINGEDGVVLEDMSPIYTASVDVSQYQGEQITLILEVGDAADDVVDTAVLVDDLKFDVPVIFIYTRMMAIMRIWTMYFLNFHDEFDEVYTNASALGVDNETLALAMEMHQNATQMMLDAWHTDNLNDIKLRAWEWIPTFPKMHLVRRAYLTERDAVHMLQEAIKSI